MAANRPKKKRQPSPKAKKLVQLLAKGIDRQSAGLIAGYSPKNVRQSVSQALRYLHGSFPDLMEACGLTDRILIDRHLKPLLKAYKVKHWADNGRVKDSRKYADNDTRLAALDMAFRLKGTYAPLKTETENKSVDVIVVDLPRPIHLPETDEN